MRREPAPDGYPLRLSAIGEAYHNAFYALAAKEVEDWLRNPQIRELLMRQTRELLEALLSVAKQSDSRVHVGFGAATPGPASGKP